MSPGPVRRVPVAAGQPGHPWLCQEGYFRVVVGYDETARLLCDPRMHADFIGLFEGAGVAPGLATQAGALSLLSLNGEEHRRHRAVVAADFTPRAVERVRPLAEATAQELVGALLDGSPVDLIRSFAEPYVARTTCGHLGIPVDEYLHVAPAVAQLAYASKDLGNREATLDEAGSALLEFAHRALTGSIEIAPDGAIARITTSIADGSLSDDVGRVLIASLLSAGNEPTVNQLCLSVLVLSEHPALWDELGSGILSVTRAVEELLRFRSTNQAVVRRVAESFAFEGVELHRDEHVLLSLDEANHDPRHVPRPESLDLTANTAPHLAFGIGPHHCLGAALARVQLQEALRALTARLSVPDVIRAPLGEPGGLASLAELVLEVAARR